MTIYEDLTNYHTHLAEIIIAVFYVGLMLYRMLLDVAGVVCNKSWVFLDVQQELIIFFSQACVNL